MIQLSYDTCLLGTTSGLLIIIKHTHITVPNKLFVIPMHQRLLYDVLLILSGTIWTLFIFIILTYDQTCHRTMLKLTMTFGT